MLNVDWDAILAEYLAGKISQRKLAEKHGVPYCTLRKRAVEEQWAKQREKAEQKSSEKVFQKTVSMRVKAAAETQRIGMQMLQKIGREMEKMMDRPGTRVETTSITGAKQKDDDDEKKGLGRVTIEYDFVRLASAFATVARTLGSDISGERLRLDREHLQLEQAKFDLERGAGDDVEAINADILSLADLINNPQPDRKLEDVMTGDEQDAEIRPTDE